MICSFECTFCENCVDNVLENVCPNCGGGFERRPVRPKAYLNKYLPSHTEVFKPVDLKQIFRVMKEIEYHPLEPFLPRNTKLLMLGSFPPKKDKWCIDFFYPNYQNDMWRIFGLIFFGDKDHFLMQNKKMFCKIDIEDFLIRKGIGIYDVAQAVIRHKDNASDNFLEIVETFDLSTILRDIPYCNAVITTGQKATEILGKLLGCDLPKIGESTEVIFDDRSLMFYRMPSSSRAYPLSLDKKTEKYAIMFKELQLI